MIKLTTFLPSKRQERIVSKVHRSTMADIPILFSVSDRRDWGSVRGNNIRIDDFIKMVEDYNLSFGKLKCHIDNNLYLVKVELSDDSFRSCSKSLSFRFIQDRGNRQLVEYIILKLVEQFTLYQISPPPCIFT